MKACIRPKWLYTAFNYRSSCADLELALSKQYGQHSNRQNAQSIHPELLVFALNCFLGLSLSAKTANTGRVSALQPCNMVSSSDPDDCTAADPL